MVSPSDSRIFGPQFNHAAIRQIFSDEHYIQAMVSIELALAGVLGKLELIPSTAADHIAEAGGLFEPDYDQLREGSSRAGFPVIELVRQLREQVGDEVGRYVHWGATTQDIMDTARVLQIREALDVLAVDMNQVIDSLAALVRSYRGQIMSGRTHSQHALPISFGFKVATWLAPLIRHRERLAQLRPRAEVLQLGGAAGTLASYGTRGQEVFSALAEELRLSLPALPWHTQRDSFVEVAGWLSMVTGSLAKMAQDILLLAQSETGELRETADPDRGGSSAMPQKQNPILSELILAAARANAALLSAMHNALIQEHERGTHGWQLEWIALPQMFALAGSALVKAREISSELTVDSNRMLENVRSSHGTMMAEAVRLALLEHMTPDRADALLKEATRSALEEGRPLREVVGQLTELELDWDSLSDESAYLGAANWFIDRVLEEAGD